MEKSKKLYNNVHAIHPQQLEISFRERLLIATDTLVFVLAFVAYTFNNYFFCLMVLNIAVPIVHCHSLYTGVQVFRRWQHNWKSLEICWMISLSTTACFMGILLLADWYIHRKWNLIGIEHNLLWSYFHYIGARVINMFHKYVRKYG